MKKYNILFFSSGRSDYELIKPIINQFKRYKNFNCYLILTGSHLSKKHGKTLNQVDYSSVKQIYKIDIECDEVDYDDFELIVVNDGSKDKTLEVMKEAFDFSIMTNSTSGQLITKKIRDVYISHKSNIILIDKQNGGKADSINAGINYATKIYLG